MAINTEPNSSATLQRSRIDELSREAFEDAFSLDDVFAAEFEGVY